MGRDILNKPLLRVLRGERVWPPPLWLMRQAGRYLPEYRQLRAGAGGFLDMVYNPELATEVTLQPLRRYGMDGAILFSDILVIPDALGRPVSFIEGEGPRLDPLRSVDEVQALDPSHLHEHLAPVYETVERLSQALDEKTTLIGFAGAPWTVATYMVEGRGGTDHGQIKQWAYRDPDGFGQLMDVLVDATVAYLARQVAAGAEAVQVFDTWAGALSETQFRRWSIAPMKAIVDGLRAQCPDVPIIGFPRGAGALYTDYVSETGVEGVGLDTTMPLSWAADNLQVRAAVQGNLDNQLLVAGGVAMDAEADRILEILGGGPLIFNLGHGVVPQTPPEHVARLVERVRGAADNGQRRTGTA